MKNNEKEAFFLKIIKGKIEKMKIFTWVSCLDNKDDVKIFFLIFFLFLSWLFVFLSLFLLFWKLIIFWKIL